jgi:putative transposase
MPRAARYAPGGLVYQVLNRGVGRQRLFEKPADYAAFQRVLGETLNRFPMRILRNELRTQPAASPFHISNSESTRFRPIE